MKTKKTRPTEYKKHPREFLTIEEAEELITYLKDRGNQAKFAREIGKSTVAVNGWVKEKEFPKYCRLFLEKIRMKQILR